jgi:glucose/arabinose dehydrogenase
MQSRSARYVLSALTFALAACGGGGGGGGGNGPANRAPVFTSGASATVAENSSGAAYSASASDADSNALTFSITGGADSGLFQITPAGALTFRTPPNFEAPSDANRDNVYEVTLGVTDGTASVTQAVQITVTNAAGTGFTVRRVGTGFDSPLFLAALPDNSGRVLVVERDGIIRILNPASGAITPTPFLNIANQVSTDGERGLLGLALAPDYMTSGRAYVYLTATNGDIQLRRYTASAGSKEVLDAATGDVLLTIPHPRNNHNGGWIGFDGNGLLFAGVGDGGGGGADPDGNSQNRGILLGKILRLDVSRDDFPADQNRDYGIPASNPYAGGGGTPEVLFYGMRNPFRASFDRVTGDLWVADVGFSAIEEVDRIPAGQTGLNFGWPLFEGTQPLEGTNPAGIAMPVLQYGHGTGPLQGNSITGGHVYRGPVEALQGLYIFADFAQNNIWSAPIASLPVGATAPTSVMTNRDADFAPNVGSLTNIASFGEDQSGNLYIVSFGGDVFRFEAI